MKEKVQKFKLELMAGSMVHWIGLVSFGFLLIASLLFTRYFPADYQGEIPLSRIDWIPITLLETVALGAVILYLSRKLVCQEETAERNVRILLGLVLGWIAVFGVSWALLSKSIPVSDQYMITSSAERFAQGNFGRFEYGKYLYYYPFQLGMAAYEELIFRLFGLNNYLALKLINVAGIAAGVFAGYRITRILFSKIWIAVSFLLLYGTCFPLLIFSTYVYGDVLAVGLCLFSVWQFLRYVKEEKKSGFWLFLLGMILAVLLRTNSLIVFIASGCVWAVKAVSERRWKYLLCILLSVLCVTGSGKCLEKVYEYRSGMTINEGMPSILWIAMGMQEGDKEAGWYNGYSIYIYQDTCQYEEDTASELGKAEIHARAKEFLKNPGYALDFYWRKFSSQWSEPTYGCFIMTYAAEEEREAIGESLYTGTLNRILQGFMNAYQLLIYASVLLLLIRRRKTKEPLEWYILLIAVIGGVLFHLLWEAKSRYVLPYFVFMLPMAAAGLYEIKEMLQHGRTKDETAETGR